MKVSVIIPTFNRGKLIRDTINSILEQSFQDFEIIVVDDGSTDDTAQQLAIFGDRIRYTLQQNQGVNNARNHAVSLARGEYIAMMDDDDLWLPHKLAVQVQLMDRFPDIAYTFSNFAIYKNSDNIQHNGIQSWHSAPLDWNDVFDTSISIAEISGDFKEQLAESCKIYIGKIYHASLFHYYVLPSSAMFRRSKVPVGVQFIEHDPICGDWDFFARLSRDNPVAYLDHETTYNRSHEDAVRLTRTAWKRQLEYRIDMIERLYMKDESFYARHEQQVNSVYRSRLLALSRQHLLQGDRRTAMKTLYKCRGHIPLIDPGYQLLFWICHIPGIAYVLRLFRHIRG